MRMNKEILIVFSYYGIGGAQRRAINLANELIKNGYKVTILALLGEDGTIKDEDYYKIDKQINFVLVPQYYKAHNKETDIVNIEKQTIKKIALLKKAQYFLRFIKPINDKINFCIRSYRNSLQLKSYLISHQGGTIIHFGFNILERTYFASKDLDFRVIYAETNAAQKYIEDKNYAYIKKLVKKMDGCVFQTKEEMREHELEQSEKNIVIYNPINSNLPSPYVGDRRKVVVNFCRLSRQKNLLLLIRAFEKFYIKHSDYQLHIYADTSNDLKYREEINNYILRRKLDKIVKILPPCADVHLKVRDAAMFVSSSDYEGLSNSMIEAMAIGLPCICTDCAGGGAREVIQDRKNGILVPTNDEEAMKKGMEVMADNVEFAKRCSINASKIREDLKLEKIVNQWIKVIEKLIHKEKK